MSFILDHTKFGFCWWDLVAAIILVAAIVYYWKRLKKLKEEKKALELQLTGEGAEAAVSQVTPEADSQPAEPAEAKTE